ncbi:DUF3015 family protein [Pigmentibacter sp. JX0631]|uniref:DUF3015 family protein n=1 Tax=Pigmentibacter sp. JX0631 TaxID=2976982 RepID=UPI0024693F7E|nr:DUF3015 family protein [Pigmentibacter sp. JX0631]WGL60158.1 DUF3015 family protein [Pigmentibacter sp. JX0631]
MSIIHNAKSKLFILSWILYCLVSFQNVYAVGAAGCGLGSVIFSDNRWWKQILAATTNGSTFSQTLGITTGTSNCNASGALTRYQEQKDYIVVNYVTLQKEAAQGNGETLKGLAAVSGCEDSAYQDFAMLLQTNYSEIFSSNNTEQIVESMNFKIKTNPTLVRRCLTGSI